MGKARGAYFNAAVETMSTDEIAAMQHAKLRRQLEYLNANSPFHAGKLAEAGAEPGDIRSVADLTRLPFTEKTELRESQRRDPPLGSHAAAAMEDVVRVHASSGTTGTPSFIGLTERDKRRWTECIARSYWAQGLRPDSVFAMGLGIGFFVGGLPVAAAVEAVGATLLPIGTGASDRLIASIRSIAASKGSAASRRPPAASRRLRALAGHRGTDQGRRSTRSSRRAWPALAGLGRGAAGGPGHGAPRSGRP